MRAGLSGARAAALGAALALALGAAAARGEARLVNPCTFSDRDSPCRVTDGTYRALMPQGLGPHPAVLYLYGSLGKSAHITGAPYFRQEVVRRGYALIVPAALDVDYRDGERGSGWGRRARRAIHPRDDLEFLRSVIRDATVRHNIDPERLVFVGQSDGGFMIWEIACHAPEMGAAFAVHAASYGGPLPGRCRRPVRFLQAHGLDDRVVPFEGGIRRGPAVAAADVGEGLDLLARTGRCRGGAVARPDSHGFERRAWEGCAEGAALELMTHRGGHMPPAGWIPAVLDWFEATGERPARAATRRVGEAGGLRPPAGVAAGRFRSVGD